jgi:hypothetical protein
MSVQFELVDNLIFDGLLALSAQRFQPKNQSAVGVL